MIYMGAAESQIKFIYDAKGNKTDVVIPLDHYAKELEDFFDIQLIEQQKAENQATISLKEIEKSFKERHE